MVEIAKRSQNEFTVIVAGKGDKRQYIVSLDDDYYYLLTQGTISKEELIRKSFQFLLERESKESILSKFNLKVIKGYFPEFEGEIAKGV
jgi:hypothetical protein